MNEKIEFGADYLAVMGVVTAIGNDVIQHPESNILPKKVTELFLVQRGFTLYDVGLADELFERMVDNKSIEDFDVIYNRITSFLQKDKISLHRFAIELLTIIALDQTITDKERKFADFYLEKINIDSSEYPDLEIQAKNWAFAITSIYNLTHQSD